MGKISKALFSSDRDDWETPKYIFDQWGKPYGCKLDVCATIENTKCKKYFCIADDGLKQDWKKSFWMNPPYGRGITTKWVKKASEETIKHAIIGVCLLAARTDNKWFHKYVYNNPRAQIYFIKGRINFIIDGVRSKNGAPFPSMIVIFH